MIHYDGSSSGLALIKATTVFTGAYLQMRVWPKPAAAQNVRREWPHVVYRPTVDSTEDDLGTWKQSPSGNEREDDRIEYRDDGAGLYCPTSGEIFLTGGVGEFEVLILKTKRPPPLCPKWQVTREFLIGDGRIVDVPCGFGAERVEVDVLSLLYFRHGDTFMSGGVFVNPEHPALVPPGATGFDIEKLGAGTGQFRLVGRL